MDVHAASCTSAVISEKVYEVASEPLFEDLHKAIQDMR
jgi:hypothetical protein